MTGEGITLDPSQERAVDLVMTAGLGVVTGGPGTGKTTILREALRRLDAGEKPPETLLCAPTGKAARRMSEATGRTAMTLHRGLEYGPVFEGGTAGRMGFRRNAETPLEEDLVIVDEASMVDVELASHLFAAIDESRTRLIFVGDAAQLPSVGPGRVFADLIHSHAVPVAQLTTLHRAAQESWICRNAPRVLAGETPELAATKDFNFYNREDRAKAFDAVMEVVCRVSPKHGIPTPQVLVPQKTGPLGANALNASLQSALNRARPGERSMGKAPHVLRPRDRVIQTKNDYQLGVFNGEIGDVVEIASHHVIVAYEGREPVKYDKLQAQALRLAYALTVHKSQGSEWPWVVVVCHSTHAFMLSRQLIYTAITRAKEGVVIVGDRKGIALALKNVSPSKRNTGLVERIRKGEAA